MITNLINYYIRLAFIVGYLIGHYEGDGFI